MRRRAMGVNGLAGDAETVVGVLEFGRDAGACRTARDLNVVAPGTAARGFAAAARRPLRVARGRDFVIARIVPVGTPLVDVVADVEESVSVRRVRPGGLGTIVPARGVAGRLFRRCGAPGIECVLDAAARRALPLCFGWQTIAP